MSNAQPANASAISGIVVKPMTNALGAEVLNVDLTRELDHDAVRVLKELFLQYKVLFFRDQDLTPEQHIAFAMHFGDEVQKPGFVPLLDGYPQTNTARLAVTLIGIPMTPSLKCPPSALYFTL
jgi:alpha-ketoglutarate-dependent taurine dioxygenase